MKDNNLSVYGSHPDGGCADVGTLQLKGFTLIDNVTLSGLEVAASKLRNLGYEQLPSGAWKDPVTQQAVINDNIPDLFTSQGAIDFLTNRIAKIDQFVQEGGKGYDKALVEYRYLQTVLTRLK
jgi:hypothetical protein